MPLPRLLIAALLAALFFPAIQADAAQTEKMPFSGGPVDMGECSVTAQFDSTGSGIDADTLGAVTHYAENNTDIMSVRLYPGMQGQQTLCITTRLPGYANSVFEDIKKMLPPLPAHGSTITLSFGMEFYTVPDRSPPSSTK